MNRTITFVRHGNAEKAAEGDHDSQRKLSDKGRLQASKRRASLSDPTFDLVLASPMQRAQETVGIIAGTDAIVIEEALFTPKGTDEETKLREAALNGMFEQLGYSPLSAYFAEKPGDVNHLCEYGADSWDRILYHMDRTGANTALIGGHAVLLPIIGYEACFNGVGDFLLDVNVGECEGFVLEIDEEDEVVKVTPLPWIE